MTIFDVEGVGNKSDSVTQQQVEPQAADKQEQEESQEAAEERTVEKENDENSSIAGETSASPNGTKRYEK